MWAESHRESRARSPLSFNVRRLQPMPKGKAVPRLRDLGYRVLDESVGAHRIQTQLCNTEKSGHATRRRAFCPRKHGLCVAAALSDYGA